MSFEHTPFGEKGYEKKWLTLLAMGLGTFMSTLDMSIVNIALPTLVEELHTNFATIQWVILSYALVITSTMLGVARLGDMYGKMKIYTVGLVLFTLSSLLCGLSPSVEWLIGFRAVQGIGAVMSQALGAAILTEVFPPSERGKIYGLIGTTVSFGLAAGPAIGGLIIGLAGWQWIFLVNVPIGVLTVWLTIRYVPNLPPVRSGQRFDYPGAIILFATLALYAVGMTYGQAKGFQQGMVLMFLGTAAVGLVVFIVATLRAAQPMLDPSLFRNVLFTINLIMGFLIFITLAGMFILPFYLQLVKGFRPEHIGLLMIVSPAVMGIVAPIAGTLSDRFGSRGITLLGLVVTIFACYLISTLDADTTSLGYAVRLSFLGIGLGLFSSPNMSAIMGTVPRHRLGVASGLVSLSRTLGQTTGVPLMGAIFAFFVMSGIVGAAGIEHITTAAPEQLIGGIRHTFRIAEIGIIASTLLAVAAIVIDRKLKVGKGDAPTAPPRRPA